MTWEAFLLYIIRFICTVALFSFFAKGLVLFVFKNRRNLFWIIPSMACLLTILSIFQLQDSSVLFKTEATVLQKLNDVKQNFVYQFSKEKEEDDRFVRNNIILINTSFDPYLIPNRERLTGDSTLISITDRKKLSVFLNYVHDNLHLFDLIICDIVFQDSSIYDRTLASIIAKLDDSSKIILAYNEKFINRKSVIYEGLHPNSFGEVAKVESDEPFYFTHRLVSEENIPSISYQMHLRLSGNTYKQKSYYLWPKMLVEHDKARHARYAFNEYITELQFTDEKNLYVDSIDIAGTVNDIVSAQNTSLISSRVENLYDLGYACTEDGQLQISDLAATKSGGQKNIIMIGNFRDSYSDKHQTAYGPLYGTTILLNEFFQIYKCGHLLTAWQIFAYPATLFVCFCGVLAFLFWRAFREEMELPKARSNLVKGLFSLKSLLVNVMEFLLDETHYLLLFAVALVIDVFFKKIINVLGLLYYFLLFSTLLKFFIRKAKTAIN